MPKRALVLIDIQNDYFPGGIESAADYAAQVHAAFTAALKFGYAKAVSAREYLATNASGAR
jgi:nicotinamidase-related amidase